MTTGMSRTPIDTSKPHSARVYDWLLGGKDNYPVDQAVAEHLPAEAKIGALQNRAFMSRATAWLAGEGIEPGPADSTSLSPGSRRRSGDRTPATSAPCAAN